MKWLHLDLHQTFAAQGTSGPDGRNTMTVWKSEKLWLSLVLFGFGILGLIPALAQQSVLTFQPAVITTLVGTGVASTSGSGDGGVATGPLGGSVGALVTNGMKGVAADAAGDVFFFDASAEAVRVVYEGGSMAAALITAENSTVTSPVVGNIYIVAGIENSSGTPTANRLATTQKIGGSNGGALALDSAGDIYLSGTSNEVWVVYAGGTGTPATKMMALERASAPYTLGYIYKLAGNGTSGGTDNVDRKSTRL